MITIYLDFDNTIVESNQQVIKIINQRYGTDCSEDDLKDYGFNSIYKITENEKLSIFESDDFFTDLQFTPNVIDVIRRNYDKFNWVITTKGTPLNLQKKFEWLNQHWPFEMEKIGITNDGLSKSSVDMANGIQIDDTANALDTNADVKILYKDFHNYYWQQVEPCDNVLVVNDWNDIENILQFYACYDIKTLEKRR